MSLPKSSEAKETKIEVIKLKIEIMLGKIIAFMFTMIFLKVLTKFLNCKFNL